MNIDCTLKALMLPGFAGLDPPFGTKKGNGEPIQAYEAMTNNILPFKVMRPLIVPENSTTTQIQTNTVFEIVTGGITLTLAAAAYSGCRVSIINSAATSASVVFDSTTVAIGAKEIVHLEYASGRWVVIDDYSDGIANIAHALDLAGLANKESVKTARQRIQQGAATIKNRGVISGCSVSKSTTAIRNINLATGKIFIAGLEMPCPAKNNAALVPVNTGAASGVCYAYLYINANGELQFACTPLGANVPDYGLPLYRITIPAGNTEANAPNLENVTLSDVRRVEAGYPVQFNSIANVSVSLPYTVIDSDYAVYIELMDFKGGSNQRALVYPGDKAANGFKLYAEGTLDMVTVKWTAVKMSL